MSIVITAMGRTFIVECEDKGGLLWLAADIATHQAKLQEEAENGDQAKENN